MDRRTAGPGAATAAGAPAGEDAGAPGRVLGAATDLLREHGASALTVRRIAAAAGTSTMTIYHHYGGKDGVLDAVFRAGYADLRARLEQARTGEDVLADLLAMCRVYRQAALEHPSAYQLMFTAAVPGHRPSEAAAREAAQTLQVFVDAVQAAVDAGRLQVEPERAARILWATAHGLVSLAVSGHPPLLEAHPELYRAAIDAVLRGMTR